MYLLNLHTKYEQFNADTEILEWELLSCNMFLELVVMCSLKRSHYQLILEYTAGCVYGVYGLYCNYLHLDKND